MNIASLLFDPDISAATPKVPIIKIFRAEPYSLIIPNYAYDVFYWTLQVRELESRKIYQKIPLNMASLGVSFISSAYSVACSSVLGVCHFTHLRGNQKV